MRVIKDKKMQESTVMLFYQKKISPEVEAALKEIYSLLGLKTGVSEVEISYGLVPKNDREIAMITRSIMQIMMGLAAEVEIPASHVKEGRVAAVLAQNSVPGETLGKLLRIKNAVDKPVDAFVAVKYRDHWFWVDDCDFASKRIFSFVMLLFSLTETGGREGLPLVTIPAG